MKLNTQSSKKKLKTITFKIEEEVILEFRSLSKELRVIQSSVIQEAMKRAIIEMNELKKERENEK